MSVQFLLCQVIEEEVVDLVPAVVELGLVLVVEVVFVPGDEVGAPAGEGEAARAVARLPHPPPPRAARGQQDVLILGLGSLEINYREILYRSALKRLRTSHLPLLMSFHSMLQAVRSPFHSFR